MHFTEAISLFVSGILARAVAHRLVRVAPLSQAGIDIVLVGVDQRAGHDRGLDQRLDGRLLDVLQHADHPLASALDHPEDRRLLFLERAPTGRPLQTVSPSWPPFFLTAAGCPLCPAT